MSITKTRIIRIGNSQGVRIPRTLLEQAGLLNDDHTSSVGQEVELEVDGQSILVRRARRPRAGWQAQFQQMADRAMTLSSTSYAP